MMNTSAVINVACPNTDTISLVFNIHQFHGLIAPVTEQHQFEKALEDLNDRAKERLYICTIDSLTMLKCEKGMLLSL